MATKVIPMKRAFGPAFDFKGSLMAEVRTAGEKEVLSEAEGALEAVVREGPLNNMKKPTAAKITPINPIK